MNHIVADGLKFPFAEFVGDAFLRLRERQNRIEHFKAFQKIRLYEAAAVAMSP